MQTQWRYAGMDGEPTGFDYAGVAECARWMGIDLRSPRIRNGLQTLEKEHLSWGHEKRREKAAEKPAP